MVYDSYYKEKAEPQPEKPQRHKFGFFIVPDDAKVGRFADMPSADPGQVLVPGGLVDRKWTTPQSCNGRV